jgi:hypothetical protein
MVGMNPIELEDIVPRPATFYLERTKKTYHLRAVSLEDELWMRRTFGDEIQNIFSQIQMEPICRIVFRQLEEKDKEDFLEQTVTLINEKGQKISETKGGSELLLCLICGFEEKIQIFKALMKTIGISRPILEQIGQTSKTQSPPEEKKRHVGPKSSTSSRKSTVGRRSTSSRERRAK